MDDFNEAWYHKIIERYSPNHGDGRSILAAACIIAQSLDTLSNAIRENHYPNDELGHEICMGIRKGIFGSDAPEFSSILDLKEEKE